MLSVSPLPTQASRSRRVLLLLALTALPGLAGAPRRPPELSPEERAQRQVLQPLRDTPAAVDTLQPLLAWIDGRVRAGEDRAAERALRRTLGRMHDEFLADVNNGIDFLRVLRRQRNQLYDRIADQETGAARAREDYQKLLPVPAQEDIVPSLLALPENFLHEVAAPASGAAPDAGSLLPEVAADAADDTDLRGLMNRLTADLTALEQLTNTCQTEIERERQRHRYALEALDTMFRARREAARAPSRAATP